MRLAHRLRALTRAMQQKWGTVSAKRNLWNSEFQNGRWDYLEQTGDDCVYAFIERHCNGGSVLDLGCGSGNTGHEVREEKYGDYTGVDISDVAVQKAIHRTQGTGRARKNRYVHSDISTYRPDKKYHVILFREALYYTPRSQIRPLLRRYCDFLTEQGVFILRMCDRNKFRFILETIESNFRAVEKYLDESTPAVIIVFR